ncbi:MAG: GNAT family N-acetyltransferase [Actinobacteria bacterium]|nr:GNAT family N-acetyltransferase [Actinomycetota bacterium]
MPEEHFIREIEHNLFESWKCLARAPGCELLDEPEMLRFTSGIAYPLLNSVLKSNIPGWDIKKKVAGTLDFFRKRDLPMLWWITPSTKPPHLNTELEKEGLVLAEAVSGMGMDLGRFSGDAEHSSSAVILPVKDKDDLDKWLSVFETSYEMPGFIIPFFRDAMRYAGLGPAFPFRHFTCLINETPVACATIFIHENTAGLYNVGTVPQARGKGAGAAISAHSISEAIDSGCRAMVLHATEMGEPIYKRLGFKKFCEIKAYVMQ